MNRIEIPKAMNCEKKMAMERSLVLSGRVKR